MALSVALGVEHAVDADLGAVGLVEGRGAGERHDGGAAFGGALDPQGCAAARPLQLQDAPPPRGGARVRVQEQRRAVVGALPQHVARGVRRGHARTFAGFLAHGDVDIVSRSVLDRTRRFR